MAEVSVLIADDYELVRYALRILLGAEPDMVIAGEVSDAEAVTGACEAARPDVLVLGITMPAECLADLCAAVRARVPDTSVLVVCGAGPGDEAADVLAAGATGVVTRDVSPERIVEAVRCVATGQSVLDPAIAERMLADREVAASRDMLSEREAEVLGLMARGLSNKEIGRALWIGESTVKTHVCHILRKLGAADRTQAVLAAVRAGLVRLD